MDELRLRGLELVEPGEGLGEADLLKLRDRAAADLINSNYIPAAVFKKTRALLEQVRAGQTSAAAQAE